MITTKRKAYSTPELTTIRIDQQIMLVMISDPPIDPPGGFKAAEKPTLFEAEKSSSPFGGNKPDYSGM
jgi:hypothetical protein